MSGRHCRACGAPVIWARTERLNWQALDAEPDPAGNVHAYPNSMGNWLARSVKPGTPAVSPDLLMMPHAATCKPMPAAPSPAPVRGLPAGVASLAEWRRKRALRAEAGAR